jgi:predicted permease
LLIYSFTGDKKNVSVKKALVNPGTIATVVAIIVMLIPGKMPALVTDFCGMLGNTMTPLGMTLLGINLADSRISECFTSGIGYYVAAVKLLVAPLASFLIIFVLDKFLPIGNLAAAALFIGMAMPTAANVLMFGAIVNADTREGARCLTLNTILCIVTVPFITLLTRFL